MTKLLTICLSYFNQKEALLKHIEFWKKYNKKYLDKITFQIIDDCSLQFPAVDIIKHNDYKSLDIELYRVKDDLVCNIAGVRNLAGTVTSTEYMLLLDMDCIIDEVMIDRVFALFDQDNKGKVHKFNRKTLNLNHPKNNKEHPAICLIRKEDYWNIGGCEEDLVGHYGFTDPSFWYKAQGKVEIITHKDIFLLYDDQGSSKINRNTRYNSLIIQHKKKNNSWSTDYVRFEWEKIM